MVLRHSTSFLLLTSALLGVVSVLALHAAWSTRATAPSIARIAALVEELELTDLSLFTEASYTRHLAMTDRYTPFQDAPLAFEHFPTGALVPPPAHLTKP